MSKQRMSSSKGVPPKSGGIPRPSESFRPTASSTMREGAGERGSKSSLKKSCPSGKEKKRKETEFMLPALSTLKRTTVVQSEVQRIKQKTIRRNAPENEDLKMIKEIMKNIRNQEITVHEFVGLVAPYTGDNGTLLRTVLATELSHFRTLARKIYDNMTQDISDVLTNEHIQLTESSKEKHAGFMDKMMRSIDEIYEYCPDFDFEKYYTQTDYLEKLFPRATEVIMDEDQEQLLLRQEAYHRMMWLRSEGERLGAENKKLQDRLRELKGRQRDEMRRAAMIEKENEEKRKELEKTQNDLQEELEDMNNSIEKALLQHEVDMAEHAAEKIPPAPPERKPQKLPPKAKTRIAENWNVKAAAEIEETAMTEALVAESSRVSVASSKSSRGAIPKATKKKRKKPPPQETSPFHYSPPRTSSESRQQTSPFHFSPPRTPPEAKDQAEALETTRVTTTTRTIEQPQPSAPSLPRARRSLAPKDTWRGFM